MAESVTAVFAGLPELVTCSFQPHATSVFRVTAPLMVVMTFCPQTQSLVKVINLLYIKLCRWNEVN